MAINLEIEISNDDVRLMMGDRYEQEYIRRIHQATCTGCGRHYNAQLVVREVWLNHIGDLIVEGNCQSCSDPISLYLEASNFRPAFDQAMALRDLYINVLNDYHARLAGS